MFTKYFKINNKTCATGEAGTVLPEFAPNPEFSGVLIV
jgi:hypothetical protein